MEDCKSRSPDQEIMTTLHLALLSASQEGSHLCRIWASSAGIPHGVADSFNFLLSALQAFLAHWPYVKREVTLLSKLKHPHIVGFREVFLSESHLALVMTLVPGGTLSDYLLSRPSRSLSEAKVRKGFLSALYEKEAAYM